MSLKFALLTTTGKFFVILATTGAVALSLPAIASAHVMVTPNSATTGERVLFSASVPNERTVDVTGLRVVIPSGVADVTPTVHTGWTIATKKDSSQQATEVTWSGGAIPPGQRDDFSFKAQVPGKSTELQWKAYQTYADGVTVAWDQRPSKDSHDDESNTSGPYSVTTVRDDAPATAKQSTTKSSNLPLIISLVALVFSVMALTVGRTQTSKPSDKKR